MIVKGNTSINGWKKILNMLRFLNLSSLRVDDIKAKQIILLCSNLMDLTNIILDCLRLRVTQFVVNCLSWNVNIQFLYVCATSLFWEHTSGMIL